MQLRLAPALPGATSLLHAALATILRGPVPLCFPAPAEWIDKVLGSEQSLEAYKVRVWVWVWVCTFLLAATATARHL